jgi:hypothetical protein
MTTPALGPFERDIARLAELLGGRREHARFLFDDLASEAAATARRHGVPFCRALRAALTAFQIDFVQSRDAAIAHTAACARLEVFALLSGSRD